MAPGVLADIVYQMLISTLILIGPVLLIATAIGLSLGLFQAITQIQDQMLPTVTKILAISFFLIASGARLSVPIFQETQKIFDTFHLLTMPPPQKRTFLDVPIIKIADKTYAIFTA